MRLPDEATVRALHRRILRWYRIHQREFRWRETRDPYEILVSEIMLQQTQVERVREKLPLFLQKFPAIGQLSDATRADVIRAWKGMGYNNRAIRLHDLARIVVGQHDSRIPSDPVVLAKLPGVGHYTAHAVACFAFNRRVPVVDVNIRRVLSRVLRATKEIDYRCSEKEAWRLAAAVLPTNPYTWNQALMDFGSAICTARKPGCAHCPIDAICRSNGLQQHAVHARSRTQTRSEPSRYGIPRRIWRGKIVELLRHRNGSGPISVHKLVAKLKPGFRESDLRWFLDVLRALERDQLVVTQEHRGSLRVGLSNE